MMEFYSDSSFNPIITNQNDVRILDPNPYGEIVPPEDLFIYISLIAKQKSKSVLTQTDDGFYNFDTFKVNTIDLANPQETIPGSTLFKSKPNLTTDWTEIGGHNAKTDLFKDYEGFGITNIDIKIQSQTAPQVIIDFIDVRGATLFEQGSCSPYGLFFNLPYPIFVLTVKGYFGRPVEYYLNLVKFNSKFNSDTGNMECRAEFIGYSFAFLSDTIMGYVAASQYLKEETYNPQTKLRKKYQQTVDWDGNDIQNFCDNTAVGDNRCYTIKDLQSRIENFDQYTVPKIANSPEFNELENLEELKNYYSKYEDDVNELVRELTKKCPACVKNSKAWTDAQYPVRFEFTDPAILLDLLNKDNGLLKQYFGNTSSSPYTLASDIISIKDKIIRTKPEEIKGEAYVKVLTSASAANLGPDLNDPINKQCSRCDLIYDQLSSTPWNNIFNTQESIDAGISFLSLFNNPPIISGTSYLDLGYILKDIQAEKGKLSGANGQDGQTTGVITQKRDELISNINDIVKDQLGFNPTVRNIFTIILCNTDAFMDILVQVAVEAEKHHEARVAEYQKLTEATGDGNVGIQGSKSYIGTNTKVYPWPTYYKREYRGISSGGNRTGQNQGTKEEYPGRDSRFSNWVEVRFVEDFIDAFLEYKRDLDILNGEREGKPGYDNYQPINPLESPAWHDGPIKYYGVSNPVEIYNIIGERLFVALDHSLFSPIRLSEDSRYIPAVTNTESWSTLNNFDNENLSKNYGKIEAWNFLNVNGEEKGVDVIRSVANETKEEFIQNVINRLNLPKEEGGYGPNSVIKFKASDFVAAGNLPIPGFEKKYGFSSNDEYYLFYPGEEGILLSHPTEGDTITKKYIKGDPYKMGIDELFWITTEEDVTQFEIKIVPEGGPFQSALNDFTTAIKIKTSNLTFNTPSFKDFTNPINQDKQKLFLFDDSRYYTTLGSFSRSEPSGTQWWKDGDISKIDASNMSMLAYWDYSKNVDATQGISIFKDTPMSDDDNFYPTSGLERGYDLNEDVNTTSSIQTTYDISIGSTAAKDGIATTFVTTPLWLDNVNSFRTAGGGGVNLATPTNFSVNGQVKNYTTKHIEARNLAYLFLHTLKPAPLITRYIDNEGDFLYEDGPCHVYSLKPFNIVGGVAKTHKAWLLALGAVLWRWKMFVGTKSDGTWNNPITSDDIPNGFDPLAQPGFPISDFGNSDRNSAYTYLDRVYNTSNNTWNIQTTSFAEQEDLFEGNTGADGTELGGSDLGYASAYAYFPYFNYLKDITKLGSVPVQSGRQLDVILDGVTINDLKTEYSWPMLWIAPHHIPYVHPERFYDYGIVGETNFEGTNYIQLFTNNLTWVDYQTMMATDRNNNDYYEETVYEENEETFRSRILDGNLGAVMESIPTVVKERIIEYFDQWCDETWPGLLRIVDPVNFGDTNFFGNDNYTFNPTIGGEFCALQTGDAATVALNGNSDSVKNVKKELLEKKVLIYNSTPKIWYAGTTAYGYAESNYNHFVVSKTNLDLYLGSFWEEFRKNKQEKINEINKKTTEEESGLAGSLIEDDDIKLSLYRTFKSLTDKWVSSTPEGKSFFNVTDNGRGCNKGKDGKVKTLAAHFQYVNRVMGDIGNIAMINVSKVRELKKNIKISLYQWLSDILTENEYMFFPLPGYVDFTSNGIADKDLQEMFKPVLSLKGLSCGPVFLCMYVGGNSRQLKYKVNANCPKDYQDLAFLEDDGFLVSNINAAGGSQNVPHEIGNPSSTGEGAGYTAFKIVYGQENQNHFKNIQLDQAEFSETAESLLVIDKLSQQGGTDRSSKGQNLNSVYLTRSYSCQVESLGNMMIQPMTYFDLIGVPMFNGAYLITTVEHNFKPNHATTRFKGVRQPRTTVPIVTDAAIAMDLTFKDAKTEGTGDSISTLNKNPGAASAGGSSIGGTSQITIPVGSTNGGNPRRLDDYIN